MSLEVLGSIGGSALSSAVNIYQQKKANEQNKQMAKDQMDFQERMSNTAHQRQVKDLREAGLNPVLSANSGASAPVGASSTSQAATVGDLGQAYSSGRQLSNAKKLQQQQEAAINSGIQKTDSDISVNETSKKLIAAQTTSAAAQALATAEQTKRTALENKALGAELPSRINEAKFRNENPELYRINQVSESAGKVLDGLSSAKELINPLSWLKKKQSPVNPAHIKKNSKGEFFNTHTGEIIRKVK